MKDLIQKTLQDHGIDATPALVDDIINVSIKLDKQQYEAFINFVNLNKENLLEAQQREGQIYFNLLHYYNTPLANLIRGSALDPFHDDSKIEKMLEFIQKK